MRQHPPPSPGAGRANWILLGFLAIAGYFILTEHRAHAVAYLPYLLVLACPLMHLLHGGHARHGHGHRESQGDCCGAKGGVAAKKSEHDPNDKPPDSPQNV